MKHHLSQDALLQPATGNTLLCSLVESLSTLGICMYSTEETAVENFLEILKGMLQKFSLLLIVEIEFLHHEQMAVWNSTSPRH